MNKVLFSVVLACGLLLLDSPEAAAHDGVKSQHRVQTHETHNRGSYRVVRHRDDHRYSYNSSYRDHRDYRGPKYRRDKKMPRCLEYNRSFRQWYEHTRLRKERHLTWHQVFDIYYREHNYTRYRSH